MNGEIVIPLIYDEVYAFHGGYAFVKQGDEWIMIDTAGNIAVPLGEYDYYGAYDFYSGLRVVMNDNGNWKYGAIDEYNKIIVPPEYHGLMIFNDVIGFSDENRKHGLMNMRGEVIVPAIYDNITLEDFINSNVALATQNRRSAIINKNGELVTDFIFDGIRVVNAVFSEGLGAVKIADDSSGRPVNSYIDESGNIVIYPVPHSEILTTYDDGYFKNGVAMIRGLNGLNHKYGLIDKAGKIVLPSVYSDIFNLGEGIIAAQRYENGTWDIYEIVYQMEEIGE
jgi:hypothetical protein